MPARTRILVVVLFASLGLGACNCGPGAPSRLTSGRYFGNSASSLPAATLQLDVGTRTASLTPFGGSNGGTVTMTLTPVAEMSWPMGCPTNLRVTVLEAMTIAPDPLVVGNVTIASPRLTAGCGIDGANPDQVAIENGSGGMKIIFDRMQ